ncbi:outer membrane receptor protein involved in Fe transport [Sphingomonas endophytica]|uniref:Outer membrane receptor protein involved in Fe transport n=1 Tax=Sphingomonas endophytica TaxID=869719 RepID=A0A7X0JEG5_9SPHN|nr:outer membrane receptor protein involved in Fe transport [Sphingomonas endophytica]MBB6506123.1 outer membrane receptor protein involved in Fe transport [Sphingomonas endophytica]
MASFRRRVLVPLLASAAFAAPAGAQTGSAQASAADTPSQQATATTADGDIIVTAQKRDESIQNVPISIQAIGTRRLDQLNVSNFNDYTQLLPSVAFQSSQPGVTTVYMRGVASGGDGNHSGSLPSVGVYLDEQPVTTIGGTLDIHIYDIARIESLAGPQGTLYGASSEAGTIRIITNKPDTAGLYGRVDGEVNMLRSGGIGYTSEGMLNIPFGERVALRMVGFYQKDAGFIDNVPGTRRFLPEAGGISVDNAAYVKKDYNDTETYGGRAALKIDLDDNWTATPTLLYQEQNSHGSYGYDPKVGDLEVQRFYPEYRRDRFAQAALTIEGQLGNWDVTYAGALLDRRAVQSSDYTDYAEAYDSLYSAVGGLAGYFYYQDNDGNTIDPRQRVIGRDHFKKLSQEVRVASPVDQPFRLVAGAFYQRQSNLIFQDYQIPNLGSQVSANGYPGTLWLTRQHRVDKDYAVFGEASYDLTPKLTLTAGGRVFIYDNSLVGFFGFGRNPGVDPADGRPYTASPFNAAGSSRTGVASCYMAGGGTLRDAYLNGGDTGNFLTSPDVGAIPCVNLGVPDGNRVLPKHADGQGVTYRFNATWKPTDAVLLYATASRGFRPGGINRRGDVADYAADFLTNYELGWKTTLPGGAVRFNGAVYQQNWDQFQFSFLGANSFTVIQNGPDARIRGVEMDTSVTLGGLSLTAAGAYTDARTRTELCDSVDCTAEGAKVLAPAGTRLPITPRFKISGTARYAVPIGTVRAYVQGLIAHQSSASSDLRIDKATALGRLEPYTSASLSVGGEVANYTFELFVRNLWDERGQISRFQQCGACDQRPYVVPIAPRTIGIRAGAKF